MFNSNHFGTEHQFVSREIDLWGFDHIESLASDGFVPYLTNRGWRWIQQVPVQSGRTPVRMENSSSYPLTNRSLSATLVETGE
jgi:hypothetical protein